MRRRAEGTGRHTAVEWQRLVRAWKRSGLSAREFAASVSVAPRTLQWWQWQLAQRAEGTGPRRTAEARREAPTQDVRLVRVEVEGGAHEAACRPAWEVTAPSGFVLRGGMDLRAGDLKALVQAFVAATVRP